MTRNPCNGKNLTFLHMLSLWCHCQVDWLANTSCFLQYAPLYTQMTGSTLCTYITVIIMGRDAPQQENTHHITIHLRSFFIQHSFWQLICVFWQGMFRSWTCKQREVRKLIGNSGNFKQFTSSPIQWIVMRWWSKLLLAYNLNPQLGKG